MPEANDNWKHRSKNMTCKTCMWFAVKEGQADLKLIKKAIGIYTDITEPVDKIGRCRKHSPTMNGWPVIFESDWCGDHKLDETKI